MPTKHLTFHNGQLAKKKMSNAKSPVSNVTGFTLIELLVVISIISILSVVGFSAFTNVTKSSRDAKRKADIDAITKAYEVKYDSDNGRYTPLDGVAFTSGTIPKDPNTAKGYYYNWLDNDKSGFRVCASLEASGNIPCTTSAAQCYCKDSTQGKVKLSPTIGAFIDTSGTPNPIYASATDTHTDLGPGSTAPAPSCDTTGTLTAGLVGYWKMDSVSGNTTADYRGNSALLGTLGNNPTLQLGRIGNALSFSRSGNATYVSILGSGTLKDVTNTSFTFAAWAKPVSVPSPTGYNYKSAIVGRPGYHNSINYTSTQKFGFSIYNNSNVSFGTSSTNTFLVNGGPNEGWYLIVGVVDAPASALRIYVNGALEGSGNYTGTLRNFDTIQYLIGSMGLGACSSDWSFCFDGLIDDVRIYNRALTGGFAGSEISNLYNTGSGCIPQ